MRSLLLALLLLAAAPTHARDLVDVKAAGVLRVLVWTDNLPELYAVPAATPPGLEAEILQGFADLHGLKISVVPVATLDGRIPALLRNEGDLIAGGFVNTAARRELAAFSAEIFPIRHVMVGYGATAPATVEQLRRSKVGTIKGSSWADEVKAAGVLPANVVSTFTSADEIVAALKSRRVDAAVFSVVWGIVAARKDPKLQIGGLLGAPTSVGFALRNESPQLRKALDDYLNNVRRTTTWSRLVVKYFGERGLEILKKSRSE